MRVLLASTNEMIPSAGGSPYRALVAATACLIRSDDSADDSLRNSEFTQAPPP